MHTYIYTYTHIRLYTCTHIHIYTSTLLHMYTYTHLHMQQLYVWLYIYIHTQHTHTVCRTHTQWTKLPSPRLVWIIPALTWRVTVGERPNSLPPLGWSLKYVIVSLQNHGFWGMVFFLGKGLDHIRFLDPMTSIWNLSPFNPSGFLRQDMHRTEGHFANCEQCQRATSSVTCWTFHCAEV
jgi:hypothetical protein